MLRIVDAFACGAFQELPLLYLKGGSIVPMGPVAHYVGEKTAGDPLTLIVALDHHGTLPKTNPFSDKGRNVQHVEFWT